MKKLIVVCMLLFSFWFYKAIQEAQGAEPVPNVHSLQYESSHILTVGNLYSLYWITVTWHTQAPRWLIIYDASTVPVDGGLTTSKILFCAVVSTTSDPATGTKSFDWSDHPLRHQNLGLVAMISTNAAGCITKSADGANDWFTAGIN